MLAIRASWLRFAAALVMPLTWEDLGKIEVGFWNFKDQEVGLNRRALGRVSS